MKFASPAGAWISCSLLVAALAGPVIGRSIDPGQQDTSKKPTGSGVVELAVLAEGTWDEFVPRGKEVDAIYGDLVLRNDAIIAVIANPIRGRNANMTVRDVGGSIIDLTVRDNQSDQLSAYYPSRRAFLYRLEQVTVGADSNGNGRAVKASDGKLETGDVLRGNAIKVQLAAPAAPNLPEVRLSYTLRSGSPWVEIETEFRNTSDKSLAVLLADDFRADRTFQTAKPGETDVGWFYDKWWGQAYGIVASDDSRLRLSGNPLEPRVAEFLTDGKASVDLGSGQTKKISRRVFPATNLVGVKTLAVAARATDGEAKPAKVHTLHVTDSRGGVAEADVELSLNDEFYGSARTDKEGKVTLPLPSGMTGSLVAKVTSLGRTQEVPISLDKGQASLEVELPPVARVVAKITDADGGPTPCKVQFVGIDGTANPMFFDDTGEHAVRNLFYSHNGTFEQDLPPGKYDVLITRGPEFDREKQTIEAKAGADVKIQAKLRRVIESPGWVSTDFHSHSSPSGDNTSSQLGRVLNLLAEHIEFAPCTEHNRLDTYVPHLQALDATQFIGTCVGIELTSVPGTINHQNAFPLVMKPRTQDNGAPLTDLDPAVQIKRLALWDDKSEKLVQQNHPDLGEMFFDRDGDGKPDGGYKGMFEYQDVIEVHPIHEVLQFNPHRLNTSVDRVKNTTTTTQHNNSIFNWLQLLNQGRRTPGVVNSDAHYNFHGSGFIRNYVKCKTDDPAKIEPLDIVHASEKGHIIMTNGPYLEVSLFESDRNGQAKERKAIAGDDIALPEGYATLHVRVQCPNWFDVNRVQVLLNGKPDPKLNWTRASAADSYSDKVVRFERKIPLKLAEDTHVIVVTTGENLTLGAEMGPTYGRMQPTAMSNPIFVDIDGGGFRPNGDTLGHPLPVKGGKTVSPARADPPATGN